MKKHVHSCNCNFLETNIVDETGGLLSLCLVGNISKDVLHSLQASNYPNVP